MLRTGRLVLRRWRPADLEPFAALNTDPEVMATLGDPLTRAQSDALAARADAGFDARGLGLAVAESRATGTFLGYVGLADMQVGVPGEGGLEVGWRLARAAWGHGYATEGARAALAYAWTVLELPEAHSITAVVNGRSRRVMERLGMRHAGDFDHPRVPVGSPLRPHVHYVITRPARRPAADAAS